MSDFRKTILELVSLGDVGPLLSSAREWLANESIQEADLAWMFGVCFEQGLGEVVALAPEFMKKYPESLYPVRVFFADLLAHNGLFDQASHEARVYLRAAERAGILNDMEGRPLLADGIARAFLLLTAVYTEAGARTYSCGVLAYAQRLKVPDHWKNAFTSEMRRLEHELRDDKAAAAADKAWEDFFRSGDAVNEVLTLCAERDFQMLSRRIELIVDKFRFDSRFHFDESEMLMMIHEDEKGRLLLL